LAKAFHTAIVTGYKDRHNLDSDLIINNEGEIILERAQTPENYELYTPSTAEKELTTAYWQYKHNLFCKPSNTSSGTSLTLISPPRKSSQFVISVNSWGLLTLIKVFRMAVVW
jgi:hypothetical protein